jgi:Fe-S-cluster containining protein
MEVTQPRSAQALDIDSRLSLNDVFGFACGPHVPCFTECCGKLELLVTPYDLLRLRRRLRVSSAEFLDTYTVTRLRTAHGFPEIVMRFDPAVGNLCPFVTPAGCSVYEDRPGACRIYPLGRASTTHPLDGSHREFYFTVREDHCRGFERPREWTVREWIANQGLEEYNKFNDLLMELYVLRSRRAGIVLTTRHIQMFMMSCYNTERFREFVFTSGFLKKFQVAPDLEAALREDDEALLRFAFQWLKFALFHEPTLVVKQPPV